ncbi:MAG: IS200/IS605 family transposase [Phycisphaerae bacterium]|nr:IS200/IS605 family transposase [Phycisphaerae bacterium]
MPRNVYSEINLHFVWHCKNSANMIKPATEQKIYDLIRNRALETKHLFVHEIGGTPSHVHLAVTVPPTIEPSRWIGAVKGGSSHDTNEQILVFDSGFEWQTGYGVVSFGTKDIPWVVDYIKNQKEHHRKGTIFDRLERSLEEEEG